MSGRDRNPAAANVNPGSYLTTAAAAAAYQPLNSNLTALANIEFVCSGRLTLASGTPVMTSDKTAKTTLYFTPYQGNKIGLYNGASWDIVSFSEISLSLSGYTADKNYDIWVYNDGGTATLDSTVWTDNTTRATALALQNGVACKSGALTRRYVGTIRITGTTGQCEYSFGGYGSGGTEAKLFVWNMYNRKPVTAAVGDTTASWTFTSVGTIRAANNSATMRVSFVVGIAEDALWSAYQNLVNYGASPGGGVSCGLGYDATNAFSGVTSNTFAVSANGHASAHFLTIPTAGFHYVSGCELGQTGVTFYGVSTGTGLLFLYSM